MEISVFGASGFVGSHFVKNSTRKTIAIERESRQPLSDESVYFISTTDNYNVFEDIHKDVDVNISILLDVLKNLTPQKSILNFISSWFVYGATELPADEQSACHPRGFYSITKHAAEELLISYCETFGIQYRILRLCNVYGGGDKGFSKKKNALQFLINQMRENKEIKLYHDGHFYRDYMHVEDVARAIDLCVTKGPLNSIINIGSGEKVLFKEIIDYAHSLLASTSKISTMEPPDFHKVVQVKDFYMKTDKLKALGFRPQIDLKQGIKLLCESNN